MSENKDIFSSLAQSYDLWYDTEGKLIFESELDCLRPFMKDCDRTLDVGVGTGRFAMHFKGAIGLDPSLNALKIAKSRGVKVVCGIGENLPFKNNVFDCVLFVLSLCFVKNPLIAIKEARRVLKDNGRAVICFIPKDSSWARLYEEKKQKGHAVYKNARFYSFEDMKRFLDEQGLEIEKINATLLKGPDDKPAREIPVDGYVRGAGFVCLKIRGKGGF